MAGTLKFPTKVLVGTLAITGTADDPVTDPNIAPFKASFTNTDSDETLELGELAAGAITVIEPYTKREIILDTNGEIVYNDGTSDIPAESVQFVRHHPQMGFDLSLPIKRGTITNYNHKAYNAGTPMAFEINLGSAATTIGDRIELTIQWPNGVAGFDLFPLRLSYEFKSETLATELTAIAKLIEDSITKETSYRGRPFSVLATTTKIIIVETPPVADQIGYVRRFRELAYVSLNGYYDLSADRYYDHVPSIRTGAAVVKGSVTSAVYTGDKLASGTFSTDAALLPQGTPTFVDSVWKEYSLYNDGFIKNSHYQYPFDPVAALTYETFQFEVEDPYRHNTNSPSVYHSTNNLWLFSPKGAGVAAANLKTFMDGLANAFAK